mmetsp:Transcript_23618/g.51548  ORF Transcript_23618/g.51548 Transcript_23618/m.51548 type:complete len:504 (+) Transcript_23618:136-1647(+)
MVGSANYKGEYTTNRRWCLVVAARERLLEAANGLEDVLAMAEGAHPDEAVAGDAEAGAGGGDDVRLVQDLRERVPAGLALEGHPHVGGVVAAVGGEPQVVEALLQQRRVLLVVGHGLHHGGVAVVGAAGQAAALRDVAGAVEAGGHHAVPVALHGEPVRELQLRGHHRPPEANAGEARELGEGAGLERALLGALNLEDGLGDGGVVDEDGVGGVVHDDGAVLLGERHQLLQLLASRRGAGGVVGGAEEDDVGAGGVGEVGEEAVLHGALHVRDVVELLGLLVVGPGVARHHGGVHVRGVSRVLHRHADALAEHSLEAGDVALGAIGDEHIAVIDIAVSVEALVHRSAKRPLALLRAVSAVAVNGAETLRSLDEARDDGSRHGLGGVTDAQADDLGVGVLLQVLVTATPDLREQVPGLQLADVGVPAHTGGGGISGGRADGGHAGLTLGENSRAAGGSHTLAGHSGARSQRGGVHHHGSRHDCREKAGLDVGLALRRRNGGSGA